MAAATRGPRAMRAAVAVLAAAAAVAAVAGPTSAALPLLRDGRRREYEWTPMDDMTDEWNGFDANKWRDTNPRWYVLSAR